MTKTTSQKPAEVTRQWYVVDASEAPLGRVATTIAQKLTGKHKRTYTPHVDGGDYVVVINASKVVLTGRKAEQKVYYRHSGYIGGLKELTFKQVMERDPRAVVEMAVKGMLPRNKLHDGRMKRLKIYADDQHEHTAQKPEQLKVSK